MIVKGELVFKLVSVDDHHRETERFLLIVHPSRSKHRMAQGWHRELWPMDHL